jgi:uncharacterized protein YcnI
MRIGTRVVVAAAAAAALTIAVAAPAFAHVTVDPAAAPKGAEITLGFRVPNEEAAASTVKIQIFFPSDHPILGVDPQSAPGWTDQIHTSALNPPVQTDDGPLTDYVSEVDWYGGAIRPGHFQEFYVLAQQLPTTTSQVVFKALQTYSDRNVVRWIQPVVAGEPEPDHPTPILQLTNGTATVSGSSGSSSDTTAIVGVVLGAIALVLGGMALALVVRGRRGLGSPPLQATPGAAGEGAGPAADTPPGPASTVDEATGAEKVPAPTVGSVTGPACKVPAGPASATTGPAEDPPTTT